MLYLAIGVIIFISFLLFLKWLSSPDPAQTQKYFKYGIIIAGIVLILLLLRFGMPLIAAALGALMAIIPYFNRLISLLYTFRMFKNFFKNQQTSSGRTPTNKKMTKKEAREILGVSANATNAEIKKAYQNLMKRNHPDTGGSKYLASQLNNAKDTLLKK